MVFLNPRQTGLWLAEFLPYSGLEAEREITWHSGLTIASNARNGIEMRAPSRLRNCKSSKKSRSDAKRSGIKAMSSRRGSETDRNPEGSIQARVALGAICELGFECVGTLVAKHCDGAGMRRTGLWPVPLGSSGRSQPSQGCPIKRAICPFGGHGIPVRIDHSSAAIAIPSLGIFDAPESIRRSPISAALRKTKCRVEITFHKLCR